MLGGEKSPRPERRRSLPRGTPAIWLILLGVWLLVAPRGTLADPLPYLLTLAALLLTQWLVAGRRPAGLCFAGWWLLGGTLGGVLAERFWQADLNIALIAAAAGCALILTGRWNLPPWPELRGPGTLLTFVGAAAALFTLFTADG